MPRSPRRVALLLCGCAALLLWGGVTIGQAAPTGSGSRGAATDRGALQAQVRAHTRHRRRHARCTRRAHASHGHKRCTPKPRHGASSTDPTSGPAPQAGGSAASETLTPTLPGVPAPTGGESAAGSGSGAGGASGGETGVPPSVPHVQVVAVEYHYTLSRTTVPEGKVVLQFVNDGQDEHNLNVLSGEGELESSFPKTVSHGVRETTLNMRKGNFTLFCSLPEHEAKGMKATLTVE